MYEKHIIIDELMPFWFHRDKVTKGMSDISNWHKNVEILYFIEGSGRVICDMEASEVNSGDVFVINSNRIHTVETDEILRYYCLIVDKKFCLDNGIDCANLVFDKKVNNCTIVGKYNNLIDMFKNRTKFYKSKLRISVLDLLVTLAEQFSVEKSEETNDKQTEIIKQVIEHISDNFEKEISVETLSQFAGYSRAHLSRQFKKATGMSLIEYINYIRCTNANSILISGEKSVGEVALECGFKNLSYFSKTYKKIIGKLPSQQVK